MKDSYKTLKIKEEVHARLLSYVSFRQMKNGGKRVTLCDAITELLDTAENKNRRG
ncbi:MAG: hypothetical protein KAT91_03570 [Candidatus Aenigmarchaeota archaeon]|nr:hypothetical protein [Candidatus Aenigmarchaeota archaeon]